MVLLAHAKAGHAGPAYTLMETRKQFWIIHGYSKHYLADRAELQTLASDAVRIVNDSLLTSLRDQPNELSPITPLSFWGKAWLRQGDFRKDFIYNATLSHKLWLGWMKSYLTGLKQMEGFTKKFDRGAVGFSW